MMHNSLIIRETLRETNNNALHRMRRDPHRLVRPSEAKDVAAAANELLITGEWSVRIDERISGMKEAAEDVEDFLTRRGAIVRPDGARTITLLIDPEQPEGTFTRSADASGVIISAGGMQGIWAGIVDLERELTSGPSASVPYGRTKRAPAWKVQISQAAFGSNYLVPDLSEEFLSNDVFRLLTHYGANGMTIYGDWLCYVRSESFPELNHPDYDRNIALLRDAAARATKYGIKLYYVPVSPKLMSDHPIFEWLPSVRGAKIAVGLSKDAKRIHNLCSTDPASLAFQGEVMANLFREVPELGGLILIVGGESFYHCYMRPDLHELPPRQGTNCEACGRRKAEEVVSGLLKATADAVHRIDPHVPVMAWPYSAFRWSSDPAQLELVEGMQEDVALLTTIDKDQWMQKDGYKKLIWDYSVDYTGPADNAIQQADILRRRGMDLFLKTETALGLEAIHVPYVPALQRLGEKWKRVASLKPRGVLQSWMFFGMWGSRAEELGWWASWYPEKSVDEVLRTMAERDFGKLSGPMLTVWEKMSEAVGHFPYIPDYFTGPEFIGPAQPLLFGEEGSPYSEFEALLYYLQENEETFSSTVNEVKHSVILHRLPERMFRSFIRLEREEEAIDLVIRERRKATEHSTAAYEIVRRLSSEDAVVQAALQEEAIVVEFLHRTFLSTEHTYSFLREKERLDPAGGKDYNAEMLRIAAAELDNARRARHIYEKAPWLDIALRVDGKYPSSVTMLERKIALLEEALRRRLPR